MSATGDGALTAQPDGILVPITTPLLFCISARRPADLCAHTHPSHTHCASVLRCFQRFKQERESWACLLACEPRWALKERWRPGGSGGRPLARIGVDLRPKPKHSARLNNSNVQ